MKEPVIARRLHCAAKRHSFTYPACSCRVSKFLLSCSDMMAVGLCYQDVRSFTDRQSGESEGMNKKMKQEADSRRANCVLSLRYIAKHSSCFY